MSQKRHILFLTRWYPNRRDPMPGLFVRNHALAVAAIEQVTLLYVHSEPDAVKRYEITEEDDQGIYTVRIYYRNPTKAGNPFAMATKIVRFIIAHKKGLQRIRSTVGLPDLVHVNVLTRHALVALYLKIRFRIPYLITEHWSRYLPITSTYKGFFRKMATRWCVRQAGAVTTVSENLKDAMLSHRLYNPHYYIVYNIVDTTLFTLPSGRQPVVAKNRFIHISCFEDRSKNISGLLRSLAVLKTVRSDWQCLFIGDGTDYQIVTTYATALGLSEPQVVFTGIKTGIELVQLLQQSAFLVLFSNYENMPVVINEAFACGKPVLATRVGGIPEIVKQDRGILIDAGDEEALVRELVFMLDHPEYFSSQQNREFADRNFSPAIVGHLFQQIYNQVLNR
ncbi:MAG: glycosyltransferase [Bacteroidales bacterium]|nr:glycosyltransferase [Bacteroidales bacterium]MDD2323542.1 glycosyltransferase [Bacteroidales bacterium]MDD3011510.1 glycosyltransferase [Bacteroidales bacterium]MDD3961555.1 glycosyltransferase [Bacteroidales bacterium]MDY0285035.1 glycosyltransferase [Bacteroidales bacterium]